MRDFITTSLEFLELKISSYSRGCIEEDFFGTLESLDTSGNIFFRILFKILVSPVAAEFLIKILYFIRFVKNLQSIRSGRNFEIHAGKFRFLWEM